MSKQHDLNCFHAWWMSICWIYIFNLELVTFGEVITLYSIHAPSMELGTWMNLLPYRGLGHHGLRFLPLLGLQKPPTLSPFVHASKSAQNLLCYVPNVVHQHLLLLYY